MRSTSPLVSHRPGVPAVTRRLLRRAVIKSPGPGCRALAQADLRAAADQAVVDEVVADTAGQLPGLLTGAGQQQRVLPGEVVGNPSPAGLVHHLFGGAAAQPAVLFVFGQDGDVAGAQSQGGVAFPPLAEPHRLGELHVPHLAGQHHHRAAAFDGRELLMVAGDQHPAVPFDGQADDGGHVGHRHHRGLVE